LKKAVVAVALVISSASCGIAQTPKSLTSAFTVKGIVLDSVGLPARSALVCLKDTHSRMLKIKHAAPDGHFTFTWLNTKLDYEIYAERDDLVSEKVFISGSQKAPEVVIELKLNKKQETH
jgi:hypothetical protein